MAVASYSSGHHKRSIFKTHLSTGGQQQCVSSGCSIEMAGGSTLALESDAKLNAAAGSTISISGAAKVNSGGALRLAVGSSMDMFGISRQMTSVSNSSNIVMSNRGFSYVRFPTSGKFTGVLQAPTSGVEKTICVSFSTVKKNQFRLVMGTTAGTKLIGIGSTMRHSLTFTSHAVMRTTAGQRGAWLKFMGISATRWLLMNTPATDAANIAITSATHPA